MGEKVPFLHRILRFLPRICAYAQTQFFTFKYITKRAESQGKYGTFRPISPLPICAICNKILPVSEDTDPLPNSTQIRA